MEAAFCHAFDVHRVVGARYRGWRFGYKLRGVRLDRLVKRARPGSSIPARAWSSPVLILHRAKVLWSARRAALGAVDGGASCYAALEGPGSSGSTFGTRRGSRSAAAQGGSRGALSRRGPEKAAPSEPCPLGDVRAWAAATGPCATTAQSEPEGGGSLGSAGGPSPSLHCAPGPGGEASDLQKARQTAAWSPTDRPSVLHLFHLLG